MENIEVAVGIFSSGIQICRELITGYNGWKSYSNNVLPATHTINQLCETLISSKAFLQDAAIDQGKRQQAADQARRCSDDLRLLHHELVKLKNYGQLRDTGRWLGPKVEETWYPVRSSTFSKLMVIVQGIQARLQSTSSVLLPNPGTTTQQELSQIPGKVGNPDNESIDYLWMWAWYAEAKAAERSELNERHEERIENNAWDAWYAELAAAMANKEPYVDIILAQPRIQGRLPFDLRSMTGVTYSHALEPQLE